jgi:hypothetical protein
MLNFKKSYNYFLIEFFHSLDWFQTYSHVSMIYFECYYLNKSKNFNVNLNYHLKTQKHIMSFLTGQRNNYYLFLLQL